MSMRFVPYHHLDGRRHVVVDGGPTAGTVLTLSHWPGSPTPVDLLDDVSAQIAFRALDRPGLLDDIDIVSNNHFDQDGLASAYALIDPSAALARRDRVIDVARAGDFATFVDRDSMRIAFALAAWADADRSPLDPATFGGAYDDECARLYEAILPRMSELLDRPEALRPWWEMEDAHLSESLAAIEQGTVTVVERPELDLAIVTVPDAWAERMISRFTINRSETVHPAAVNAATERLRIATLHGDRVTVECRYETWVMFRSRPVRPRPDLRVFADLLNSIEGSGARWRADAPGALTPTLDLDSGVSDLGRARFVRELEVFLAAAPAAWDPYERAR
jgi:hypothetical protein